MKIIISDIDMGDAEKTFMVSREYLARLVAMLEDGSPLPAADQPRAADAIAPVGVTVYGASDDLIEIEGDIREEFSWIPDGDETRLLAFSDGTLLRVAYDSDGIWRLNKVAGGAAQFSKVEGDAQKDTPDSVTLSGVEIKWVALGEQSAVRKSR